VKSRTRQAVKFVLRWGIAVAGIWYVLAYINLSDRVMVLNPDTSEPQYVKVLGEPQSTDPTFEAIWFDGSTRIVDRSEVWTPPDPSRTTVTLTENGRSQEVDLLAIQPMTAERVGTTARQLLVEDPDSGEPRIVQPDQLKGEYVIHVPYPLIDVGIMRRLREANPRLLWLAIGVFPVTYLLTGIRWYYLLKPLDIRMSMGRCMVLNMVGMFYSSFMLGSTGGDLVKAYYAAKQTPNRTRAVMSVLIDRIIGLLALLMLGGGMALVQYLMADSSSEAIAQSSLKVALLCGAALGGTAVALVAFFNPWIRRHLGLDYILRHLPMQSQVQRAIEVMAIYRQKKALVLMTLIGTLPVHITVVVSAMFAGMAFDLPLPPGYYFVAVPVIVLMASIPISPQGAGVMEFFAIRLTERHGATVAQAFILSMSIRLVQVLWNLVGGIFVLRGGYQAPSTEEAAELQAATAEPASA